MKSRNSTLAVALLAGLLGFALVVLLLRQSEQTPRTSSDAATPATEQNVAQTTAPATQAPSPAATGDSQPSIIEQMIGEEPPAASQGAVPQEGWLASILRVTFRLLLGALLVTILTKRPRGSRSLHQLTPAYVAQTQILLAVVASALMMVVGDSAARAFGIFAAASLVRFRTNIRDPKEITILLISLAVGLATGVGRWDLAVTLTVLTLPLLLLLEHNETKRVFRSMELRVATKNIDETQNVLKRMFRSNHFSAELRAFNLADETSPAGELVYYVNINLELSTDQLSEQILSNDLKNITSIEWQQKKSESNIY